MRAQDWACVGVGILGSGFRLQDYPGLRLRMPKQGATAAGVHTNAVL